MTKNYPVVLTPAAIGSESGYAVYVPDMKINTQGFDMAEAIFMARDAIGIKGVCEQDEGRAVPEPSAAEPAHGAEDIVTWVGVDFEKYRSANETRAARVNAPYVRGVNFS